MFIRESYRNKSFLKLMAYSSNIVYTCRGNYYISNNIDIKLWHGWFKENLCCGSSTVLDIEKWDLNVICVFGIISSFKAAWKELKSNFAKIMIIVMCWQNSVRLTKALPAILTLCRKDIYVPFLDIKYAYPKMFF